MKTKISLAFSVVLLMLSTFTAHAQDPNEADSCFQSLPFCTADGYVFPASSGDITAEPGIPYYGCYESWALPMPCPTWFHLKIANPGDLDLYMSTNPPKDIDFICWGPFDDPVSPCIEQLDEEHYRDCGSSPAEVEECNLTNTQTGEYYIIVISNWTQDPCTVTFEKIGGDATTDCTIVPPQVTSNSPVCEGEDLVLSAEPIADAIFNWSGPGGFTAVGSEVVIPDVTTAYNGLYTVTITIDGSTSDPTLIGVVVHDSPEASAGLNQTVWYGTWTDINGSVTGTGNYTYSWTPADMVVDNSVLVPTTVPLTTTTNYTLTITDQDNGCSDQDEMTVNVIGSELTTSINAPVTKICQGESVNMNSVNSGGTESYTISWTSDPPGYTNDTPFANVTPDVTTTYFVEVSDGFNTVTDAVTIEVIQVPTVDAGPDLEICANEVVLSNSDATNYGSFLWTTSGTGSFNFDNILHPTYFPSADDALVGTVTLSLEVFTDPACSGPYIDDMVLNIGLDPVVNLGPDLDICTNENVEITDATFENAATIIWTHNGTGSLANSTSENPVYTPSDADFDLGTVTLTATVSNAPCSDVIENKVLNLYRTPTVYAGADETICETENFTIPDANGEHYSSVSWTTLGNGTFTNANTLTPTYTPGPIDVVNGEVELILSAGTTAPCPGTYNDTVKLFIARQITLDVGADTSLCGPVDHTIVSFTGGNFDDIVWSSTGTGVFSNLDANPLQPTFTPGIPDVATDITITATASNAECPTVTKSVDASIFVIPLITLEGDTVICENQNYEMTDVDVQFYFTLQWSTGGSGTFSSLTDMNPIYTPSGDDIANGGTTLRLDADITTPCAGPFYEENNLNIRLIPTVDAGNDTSWCDPVQHQISGVTAADQDIILWSTSGTGSFDDPSLLNPAYTPSEADMNAGSVTLSITVDNVACDAVSDSKIITLYRTPIYAAGPDQTICSNEVLQINGATSQYETGINWTTSGSGSFSDTGILDPVYTPSAADIASSTVTLTMEAESDASCGGPFTDSFVLNIEPEPILEVGADRTVCNLINHDITGVIAQNYTSISWSTSGSGSFINGNTDSPGYTPSEADYLAGNVTLTALMTQTACADISDSFILSIVKNPVVEAGDDGEICSSEGFQVNGASINEHYTSMNWSTSGSGTFSNNGILNPTYTPSAGDIALGSVTLTLEAFTDAPCPGTFTDDLVLLINPSSILEVGADRTVCDLIPHEITGVTAQNYLNISWTSSGTGTFTNDDTDHPSYTPSEQDYLNGAVTITCSLQQTACPDNSDSFIMTILKHPEVFAGDDMTICEADSPLMDLATINEHYTAFQWSTSGTGSFSNSMVLNPRYYPSPQDANNGMVTLTLEAFTDAPCPGTFTDDVVLTIMKEPIMDAGEDKLVCNTIPHLIDGATAINYQSITWASSGTGTFSAGTTITPTYTPSVADMDAGSVILTMTVSNPPCDDQVDQMTLSIAHPPIVEAGGDAIMCAQEPFVVTGASAEHYTSLQWTTSGTGSIVNSTTLAPQYIPSEDDITTGTVALTLEAFTNNPCDGTFTDQMMLNIVPQPVVNAGANETVCEGDTLFVTDATVINYQEVYWNGTGTGGFINGTTLTPAYIPSSDDIENSPISLTLHAINEPCEVISDSRTLSVTPLADVWAGPDTAILAGETYHVTPAFVENYSYYLWTSSGSGSFDNPTYTNPVYTPSPMDTLARVVYLTLSATSMGDCGTTTDYMKLIINDNPYVDFIVQHPCAETPVQFAADTIIIDTAKVIEYHWDFGDGTFSDEMNPVHTYAVADTYEVTLTITDTLFAQYSETKYVDVNPLPYAFFSYDQPTCSSSAVNFHDESNVPSGYITTWHFDFGDGSDTLIFFPDIPEDVAHVYPMDMTYDVTLTVETSQGCIDNFTQQVTVEPAPIAMFEYADTCQNMAATFTSNTVVNGGGNIVEYFWNFGDPESGVNNYAEGESAYHIYSAPGDYTVQHVAVNAQGCSDTVTETITILEQPAVDFTFESNCQDQNVTFAIDPDVTNIADLALWHWDFGDGSESWEQNPVHIYAAAGVYTVTLYIENTAGCSNSVSQVITISDAPSALFDYSAPTCFGDPVDFVYISNPGAEYIVTWNWDWGNGETSTVNFPDDPNMSITYAEAGTYQVTLEVINASGCTATYSTDVVVNPTPVANLSFEQACQGNEVAFTSLSQGNGAGTITHYEWNFGDPVSGIDNTSDLVNPTHIYDNPGTYDVSLTVTAINGCSDTRDTTITVNPAPEVDFAFEAACLGDATVFNSSDYVDVASIGEWHWDFGDGTTSNNPDPEHVYVIAGSYEVVLTVTDINGCDASAVKTVDIMNAPVAAFIFNGVACEGGVISFDDQSTADEVISQWVWDFGDGNTVTVDYPNNPDIEHTFVQDGTFNVTLSIITETACESTYTQEVIISTAPEALIEYTPACLNAPFEFEGDALLNGGTEIWQWTWDFGDPLSGVANTSELQNATHTYTTAGTYTVSLIVTNVDGCTDTAFVDVSVGALPEIAMLISSPTCLGDTVSVDPDQDIVDMGAVDFIHWDMGDGNEYTADSVDHIYEFAGIYEITMTLTDTSGCVVSTLSEVEVTEKPIVQFDASAACEGNETQFTDYSYVPSGEMIIEWAWDFDVDGAPGTATSELQNPTYNYPEAGDYTVRLVATSASGCMDSIDMMISVLEGPNAGFTFEEFNCEAGKVIFTDTSEMTNNIPIVAWEWTFQDGYYSDEQHPYHIFDNTDETYDVILKVTDINGCEDSDTVAVYVPKALEVDFEYTPTCVGDVTYFNDTLIAPVGDTLIQWQWEFGDAASGANNFSTNQSPSHTYPEPGNYVVTLTATDKHYCTYTISKSIEIFPLPTAQCSYDQPQCSEELYFTDLSVGVVSQIQQWEWNWGDGSPNDIVTSAQTEPLAHTYLVDGDYDVTLTVTDENNCVHSFMMTVTKNPCVQALFAMSQDTICARNEVTIFDQSIPVGEVDNWAYDMGDGTTYTFDQTNYTGTFDHTYTVEGRYTITLNVDGVVNGTLYMDSEMHEIEVLSTPVPAFVAENVCFGLETQFIDQSTDAAVELVSWNWDLGDEVHTSTQQDTSIIYAEYNTYDVKLIVENEAGCKDSITQQTRVYANPEADFSWDISCVTKPTFFYDETTLPEEDIDQEIVEWNWDFGVPEIEWDGSVQQDPYYVYDSVMIHPVTLTVTDNHDCISTQMQDVDTYVVPKANFTYEESDKMQGVVQFTDLSTGGEDLTWEYLDQLSIEQNPEITFEDDGTFPIHQIVKNEYQCADTMTVLYEMLFRTLFIPNAFSPNNPNSDVHEFKPVGRNLAEYRLQIYDLRGNLLFESTKLDDNGVPEEGWDGRAMGIEMPAGIYMYQVTGIFEDGSIYNGTVIGDYEDSQMSNRGQLLLIR